MCETLERICASIFTIASFTLGLTGVSICTIACPDSYGVNTTYSGLSESGFGLLTSLEDFQVQLELIHSEGQVSHSWKCACS